MSVIILGAICSILFFTWVETILKNHHYRYESEVNKRAWALYNRQQNVYYQPPAPIQGQKLAKQTSSSSGTFFMLFLLIVLFLLGIYVFYQDSKTDEFQAERPNIEKSEYYKELNAFD
jgi:hypothetical protein